MRPELTLGPRATNEKGPAGGVGPLTQDDATGRLHRSIPTNSGPSTRMFATTLCQRPDAGGGEVRGVVHRANAQPHARHRCPSLPGAPRAQRARNHARLARAHAHRCSRQLAHALTRAGQVGAGLWALLAILQLAGILDVGALELAAHTLIAVAGLVVLAGAAILLTRLIWTILQVVLGAAIILAAGLACLGVLGMIVGR